MKWFLVFFLALLSSASHAQKLDFVVEDIRVEGLQRVSAGSVFSAFPINVGERVDQGKLAAATRSLFKIGLFTDIQLSRDNSVLILTLVERPSISKIEVEGNKNIEDEDLLNGLRTAGLAEGEVFQRSTLERVELEILRSYIAQGRYNASVEAAVEELARNRVQLNINIVEGPVATIHHLNFIGNTAFDDEDLRDLMELKVDSLWNSLLNNDKYSKQKLNGDLERIRSHYLNNGYIQFSIESTQVSVSPDREQVFITVNLSEGPLFTLREVHIKGDLKVEEKELRRLLVVKPGDTFSRQNLTFVSDVISKRLGAEGYTFANVNAIPETHEDNTATVTFYVDPGKRTYVNRINFQGNIITADDVLRQEMQQMEAAAASTDLIERSKSRLERLGFFKSVNVETPLVPGTDDKIDVNFSVEEQPTGSLSANLGYTQGSGIQIGASISEKNFWGTGRNVGFSVNRNSSVQSANFSYKNPYFTVDGVSRGFSVYFRETDYDDDDAIARYASDSLGASMNFGYPIDFFSKLEFGFGYSHTSITLPLFPAQEFSSFIEENGDSYDFFELSAGWNRSTYNRGVFPTNGARQRFFAKLVLPEISDYHFFKMSYSQDRYFALSDNQEWALHMGGELSYGDGYGSTDRLPFFENFFAGGIGSVRAYESNSLGPRSTPDENDVFQDSDAIGGNFRFEGTTELIFPFLLLEDRSQVRSLLFFDFGNVFDTSSSDTEPELSFSEIRASYGAAITWITPIGPLSFSYGRTLRDQPGDEREYFQFLLGQTF